MTTSRLLPNIWYRLCAKEQRLQNRLGMTRNKHPNKEIEEALKYAEDNHWRIENSKGHPFGQMYCPYKDSNESCEGNGKWCRIGIWSTPRNLGNHARDIKKVIDRCMRKQAEQKDE